MKHDTLETRRYGLKNNCKTQLIEISAVSFPSLFPSCFMCYCICAEDRLYGWSHETSTLTISSDCLLYKKFVEADVEDN